MDQAEQLVPLEMGDTGVPHTRRVWGHITFVRISLFFFSLIEPSFSFTWKFTATVPHTFSSLCTTKNTWTHLNGPKSFPDDSGVAKAPHTWASCFICISSHATAATTTNACGYQMYRDYWIQQAVLRFDFTKNPLEMGRNCFGLLHGATGNL